VTDPQRSALLLALGSALCVAALAARLPVSLDGQDSVNFALALAEFDPRADQPHFPGYPVYVALCRGLRALGLSEPLALALPGVLAAAALAPCTALVARRLGLPPAAQVLSALLLASHPLLLVEGPRPMPDLLGTCGLWGAFALALGERPFAAGLLFAALLGVRVDLAPCAVALALVAPAARSRLAYGTACGIAAWLPLALAAYPPGSLPALLAFGVGHFTAWGSTAVAGAGSTPAVLGNLHALGPGVAALGLGALGLRRAPREARRALALALAPYLIWVSLGQNLANARHLLPLVPACALLAAHGLATLATPARRVAGALALGLFALPALLALLEPPLDGRAAVLRAVRECGDCVAVYAGSEERLFAHYAPPGFPAYRRASIEGIRRDLRAWRIGRAQVLVTSGVSGAARYGPAIAHLGRGLELYRIETAALR
jgi:hypothetical protein